MHGAVLIRVWQLAVGCDVISNFGLGRLVGAWKHGRRQGGNPLELEI